MKYPNLLLLSNNMGVLTRAALASRDEALKAQAFYGLAFWVLQGFANHEGLQEVQLTAVYQNRDYPGEQLVEVEHHLKAVAVGADLGLGTPDDVLTQLSDLVPLPYLGEGHISVVAESELVATFVAAVQQDDLDDAETAVHRLALTLTAALGRLAVKHRLNSCM